MVLAIVPLATAPLGAQTVQQVGSTTDRCRGGELVTFQGKLGKVTVRPGESKMADLPALTKELHWYCAGSRERVANGREFNRLRIHRDKDGRIDWTFFHVKAAAPSEPGAPGTALPNVAVGRLRVGDTKDACDRSHLVRFQGKHGAVQVKAGQEVLVELPNETRELKWNCGDSNERCANPTAFDWVGCERASNGAIHWVFYRSFARATPRSGNYVHNVRGDLRVGVNLTPSNTTDASSLVGQGTSLGGALKSALDQAWESNRARISAELRQGIAGAKIQVLALQVAGRGSSELRVANRTTDIALKYVVHDNQATVKLILTDPAPDPRLDLRFDLELVLTIPRTQLLAKWNVLRGEVSAKHVTIRGANAISKLAVGLFKSRVRAMEVGVGQRSFDLTDDVRKVIEAALAPVRSRIPADLAHLGAAVDASGTLTLCVSRAAAERCTLPPVAIRPPARAVLGRSTDKCSDATVWIYDAEKERHVAARRGGSPIVVEVDNPRFGWYCGGDAAPRTSNEEWASGPAGTHAVRVSRPGGREIVWEFLDWRPAR
ncbi:MAG: hypothetical protein KDC87_12115 [Planctomycetes bacterium]|nr:hypothetical protein [Planctomycetota bacterium]